MISPLYQCKVCIQIGLPKTITSWPIATSHIGIIIKRAMKFQGAKKQKDILKEERTELHEF